MEALAVADAQDCARFPGRSESLRLESQRGGSSRKGGAILILADKRKGPGWAATPGFPCTKIYDFSYRRWLQRMGFVYLLVIQTSASAKEDDRG